MLLSGRLGSLHAFCQHALSPWKRRYLGGPHPSADTIGRVMGLMDPAQFRGLLRQQFHRIKRNKAFPKLRCGLTALVLDGHESYSTYNRRWAGCRSRTIHTANGDRTQNYYQYVAAHLVGSGDFTLFVDLEPIKPHENEVGAAKRLFQRIEAQFKLDYDVVLADAIYTDASFWQIVLEAGKNVLTVLKQESRDLLVDARSLFESVDAVRIEVDKGKRQRILRDVDDLTSWSSLNRPVRVVQSLETWTVRRQVSRQLEECRSEWIWVTSLPKSRADAAVIAELGHLRWSIENEGFNEFVNRWHGDHVYRCEPVAILNFLLSAMFVFNLFYLFYHRNLKPELRKTLSRLHVGQLITAHYLSVVGEDSS